MKTTPDPLNTLIGERLVERHRKEEAFRAWEAAAAQREAHRSTPARKVLTWVAPLSIAACLGVLVMLHPWSITPSPLGQNYGEEIFRGAGMQQVEQLLDERRYDEALACVDSLLNVCDSNLQKLTAQPEDEEIRYEIEAEKMNQDSLQAEREKILKKMQ